MGHFLLILIAQCLILVYVSPMYSIEATIGLRFKAWDLEMPVALLFGVLLYQCGCVRRVGIGCPATPCLVFGIRLFVFAMFKFWATVSFKSALIRSRELNLCYISSESGMWPDQIYVISVAG